MRSYKARAPKLTKLIRQRYPYDCAVASSAMYLGITWEEVRSHFGDITEGIPTNKVCEFLWSQGQNVEFYRDQLPTKKALVIALSRNHEEGWHMMYFDGRKLFDPSTEKTYTDLEDVGTSLVGCVQLEDTNDKA
jgi:hypothetical protein